MKYKCCQSAISSLIIGDDALSFCCWFKHDEYSFLRNYNGETNFIEKYESARNLFIENCKNKIVNYDACFNCSRFIEKNWNDKLGIDYISLTARRKCSCNCIYCVVTNGSTRLRKDLNKKDIWDIRPVLTYLSKNKVLKEKGTLFIGAGECSEYPKGELQWLINWAKENKFSLEVASSAMFYSEEIENELKNGYISLIVSVDAGTKNTYEKIKRVKCFDKVWANLAKYIKASKYNENAKVIIKYIILDGINDSIEEFNEFINMCNKVKCKRIEISMDINFQKDKSILNVTPTQKIKKLISHIQNLNDKRIYFKSVIPVKELKTTARNYDENIKQCILNGDTNVKVVCFSGTKEKYKLLTDTDLYDQVWENITKYASISEKSKSFFSEIYVQYIILPGKNDELSEIKAFLKRCKCLNIKHIEFELISKNMNINNTNTENLKLTINYIKSLNSSLIRISDELLNIIK